MKKREKFRRCFKMKKIEYKTKEEWIEFGNQTKKVYIDLDNLFCKAFDFLPKKDVEALRKCQNYLIKFKSIAESRMFQSGKIDVHDDAMLKVFYGKSE